ncbi:MAG: alternative ribosome rescue aminoacyl-tRNA hydrolase ArfB [Acidobacteriota bacterium]|nr:alternative ribosome rescue aminoacyl-tRNA hydrolase ArfB [Acidobacteriota bacterium]
MDPSGETPVDPVRPRGMLRIDENLRLPLGELSYVTSRSSGPGGQNVNKVETRVTLLFDVDGSPSLSEEQKARLGERLATRINKEGVMRVVASKHRTQKANRAAARERFADLLAGALKKRRRRRKTRVPKAAKRRRLEDKRHRSELKRRRRSVDD